VRGASPGRGRAIALAFATQTTDGSRIIYGTLFDREDLRGRIWPAPARWPHVASLVYCGVAMRGADGAGPHGRWGL